MLSNVWYRNGGVIKMIVSKEITVKLHSTTKGLRIGLYHRGKCIGMVQSYCLDLLPSYKVIQHVHPKLGSDVTCFDISDLSQE